MWPTSLIATNLRSPRPRCARCSASTERDHCAPEREKLNLDIQHPRSQTEPGASRCPTSRSRTSTQRDHGRAIASPAEAEREAPRQDHPRRGRASRPAENARRLPTRLSRRRKAMQLRYLQTAHQHRRRTVFPPSSSRCRSTDEGACLEGASAVALNALSASLVAGLPINVGRAAAARLIASLLQGSWQMRLAQR